MAETKPSPADARAVAEALRAHAARDVRRFPTGLGHWVYEVTFHGADAVVVRLGTADQAPDFAGARHWSKTLRPLGVPLPQLLAHGERRSLPYMVLERLPGDDLLNVYERLSVAELHGVASAVAQAQACVASTEEGAGFGYARLPGDPLFPTWSAFIASSLARSRQRIQAVSLVNPRVLDQVTRAAGRFEHEWKSLRPVPFLDDATTKNVLVHAGRLSGIVDVDWLCFGDPLLTLGLTRASLLASARPLHYTERWAQLLALGPSQQACVQLYTALFAVDFLSGLGQTFNREPEPANAEYVARLEQIVEDSLAET